VIIACNSHHIPGITTPDSSAFLIKLKLMKKSVGFSIALLMAFFCSLSSWAQTITVTGTVTSNANQQSVPSVSVTVKGSSSGTFTDDKGAFKINVPNLPVVLVFSSVGFEPQEVTVTNAATPVQISLTPGSTLGQEVVVSASRVPERILESPVSIERVSTAAIRNAPAPNYYEGLANLKGVDLTTSGLLFRTLSTRGFNGSGNLRFTQLVDGMDNQAPGLNFSVGNVIGITELDVDNMELQQGASSALYGSGGVNGILLINSKSPFKYQGLSFQVKQGIMHTDSRQRGAAPYYDWSLRWGKKVSEKFAFKIGGQLIKANDWQAQDYRNLQRNNVFSSVKSGDRTTDPNYDGVNIFGDEASASMSAFSAAVLSQAPSSGVTAIRNMAAGGLTPQQIVANLAASPTTAPLTQIVPFVLGLGTTPANSTFGAQFVSRTGYEEKSLVDYNTYNAKLSGGLFYNITPSIEASLMGYYGTGTTVYTGADRYVLKNLAIGQYKAEVKSKNWFLRAYTTQENSGDSYTATTAALYINNAWKSNQTWFQQYTGTYGAARLGILPNPAGGFLPAMSDVQAHATARSVADQGRYLPGTTQFKDAFNSAASTTINKGGAKFDDHSDMHHFEGQLNLTEQVKVVDLIVGASYRIYSLNSNGTIFVDTTGRINISEFGYYAQAQKRLFNDALKLTGSLRYDKNENFDGRYTPRATALLRVAPDNNVRVSFQTAYRFPSTQDQYINLLTGGANRLIGGLAEFNEYFRFNTNPAYTAESVVAYRNSIGTGTPNPLLLQQAQFKVIKPEKVRSYEVGYRGLLNKKLLIDAYGYYSRYQDFIGRAAVGRGKSGDPARAPIDLASPFTTDNISFTVNTDNDVKAIGWGIGGNYLVGKGYEISANVSSDRLKDVPSTIVTFFNTPKLRYNIGLSNNSLTKNIGFNILYRWQDEVYWEGTFGTGDVASFGTVDAQISYKLTDIKSLIKLGASNVFNKYYKSAFGNPEVGGVYYVSFGFNVF
jgi:outer membrane receptor protein involved in Fe transport